MLDNKIKFYDENGIPYKHPERNCKKCLNYPCINNMDILKSNFAAYGCKNYSNCNTFDI